MRQRLSWDKEKVAEIMKQADPYTMNQQRTNPPASKYDVGGPSQFGEDQHMATPWKNEGRTETGHPAPAREAVKEAKKLEDKALKCITIAQRMLPGAEDTTLEDQATDLMFLPERALMATLQRQAELAAKIAGEKKEPEEKEEAEEKPAEEAEEKKEVEAKKKEEMPPAPPAEKKEEVPPAKEEVEAKKKEEMPPAPPAEKKEEEVVEAKKEETTPPAEEKKAPPAEKEVEASDKDLLDILFDNAEMTIPETPKMGAKKLSGIVKQATGSDPLGNLWDAPPDVSATFK